MAVVVFCSPVFMVSQTVCYILDTLPSQDNFFLTSCGHKKTCAKTCKFVNKETFQLAPPPNTWSRTAASRLHLKRFDLTDVKRFPNNPQVDLEMSSLGISGLEALEKNVWNFPPKQLDEIQKIPILLKPV